MNKSNLILLMLCLAATACQQSYQPSDNRVRTATQFYTAQANFYGAFYTGVNANVISLDLFSKGLALNEHGYMEGTGTNIFFSDIFISTADSTLIPDTYTADTTALPLTFLPGIEYEGNITGAYLLNISDSQLQSYEILSNGQFILTQYNDSIFIDMHFPKNNRLPDYDAHFQGKIPYKDLSKQKNKEHLTIHPFTL